MFQKNIDIESITDLSKLKKLYRSIGNEVDTINDELFFNEKVNVPEAKKRVQALEDILYRIRIRIYELTQPDLSDGTIDLYRDHGAHFTITEHDKAIPVGSIEYYDRRRIIPGNIAYEVEEPYQGHNYALRALKLVGKELYERGVKSIYITASNSENYPSIKTIESFGGKLYSEDYKEGFGPIPYTCDLQRIYSK